ncbi:MAG: transposase [Patescibacteria group bacterium]|nr:transposase [Patescibacteria group bacterium]MDD5294937.1 transposase [Patescibacteria group bacterium]MDD5554463.1 transposase [Patescibacteria group bacterium]
MEKYKDKKQYRYKGYDYSKDGLYFVTICTKDRELYFGDIVNEKMQLSKIGRAAERFWLEIPRHFPFVGLDEFIIMPNHIHGIIKIENVGTQNVGTQNFVFLQEGYQNKLGPQSKNLSSIIRGFKIGVKKFCTSNNIVFAWQARFYDRIIRNEKELNNIRQYIINNPLKWELNRNHAANLFM